MEYEDENFIMGLFDLDRNEAHKVVRKFGSNTKKIEKYLEREELKKKYKPCRCKMCGKLLTNPESIIRGYGNECYEKINIKRCSFNTDDIDKIIAR